MSLDMVGPALVRCTVCKLLKGPRGRSVAMEAANGYCGWDCEGYGADPLPSDLWPGETRDVCSKCGGAFPFHGSECDATGRWVPWTGPETGTPGSGS